MSKFAPLPNKCYEIIYCDPPWAYHGNQMWGESKQGFYESGNAEEHYPTMPYSEIAELNVGQIAADDCLLFMWTTGPKIEEAVFVGNAWSFEYITVGFVWEKTKPNPGFYTMSSCEYCLIFKKGKIPQPRGVRNVRQTHREGQQEHSRKPIYFKEQIHAMFPSQKKIELFARAKRQTTLIDDIYSDAHWSYWGNEA